MGFPIEAYEKKHNMMTLDEYVIRNKTATYMMTAGSNDMKNRGILQGDNLVVERGADYKIGDIVIATEDGDFVMKEITSNCDRELEVEAVVIAVIRKYI